ncbi:MULTISPECIES: MFS transporter [unclassified Arthrobacter]|jgi:EmrB/QacA subfamily drug resistance transporter|uniref:MFS transporter n=1 Tax=Micrococcaceae TaxID=1268 RepID=UPI0006F4B177|nr:MULTISPECIES: MFS transporter [unclassified Arthrobacter]KRE77798.1 MFS transporter [Arthrobacter sp. Soil761]MBD1591154.1 MFS transporter [Arthrobacter sp. S1_S22]TQJ60742.1 EmrB/QacA subfamily drug resistance transporter [Arthrobacter sp. SLBN-83]
MTGKPGQQRGLVPLLVIATAQLMLVLDDSIVNIALPSIQQELRVSAVHLPWIVNAYILAFGALLLLGGRLGDLYGRRRILQAGLTLFVVASLAGGLSPNSDTLIAARAIQGLGAALVAPNALALIATTFSERKTRDAALSLYGAMSALGIVVGLLLGGVLTDTLGWRWVFFINVPIAILVLLGSRTLVSAGRRAGSLDVRGAVLGTSGMVALVYAITRFGEEGFADPLGLGLVAAAALLLAAFIALQSRSSTPLVPLGLFRDRGRAGAYASMLLLAIGPMGSFYVITLYLQQVQHYSPLRTGASWLPFAAGLVLGAGAAPKLLLKMAARLIAAAGALLSAGAAFWFSFIQVNTNYWLYLAPAMFILALGFGLGIIALTQAAVYYTKETEAGIASALLNSAQQIGVALGLAVLAGVAATVSNSSQHSAVTEAGQLVAGYGSALAVAAGLLVAAGILAAATLPSRTAAQANAPAAAGIH